MFLLSRFVLKDADYPRGEVGSYEQAILQLLTSQPSDDVALAYDSYGRADDEELEWRAYASYDEALDENFDMY